MHPVTNKSGVLRIRYKLENIWEIYRFIMYSEVVVTINITKLLDV